MTKIKCPKCGCEYLPAEIFCTHELFGNPHNIIKDETGHIISVDGDTGTKLSETFVCDNCGCEFEITGEIEFHTKLTKLEEIDFDQDFTVDVNK